MQIEVLVGWRISADRICYTGEVIELSEKEASKAIREGLARKARQAPAPVSSDPQMIDRDPQVEHRDPGSSRRGKKG